MIEIGPNLMAVLVLGIVFGSGAFMMRDLLK